MTEKPSAIKRVCKDPYTQVQLFLQWFVDIGVTLFDIQLKVPATKPNRDGSTWVWLTRQHQSISAGKIIRLWPWLRHMNANGAEVYFRPARNEMHPVVFIDDLSIDRAEVVAGKYGSAVIVTSPGNTHVWVKTNMPLSQGGRKEVQSRITATGWGDTRSSSGEHLGRLCGMFSQKRKCWVNACFFSCAQGYQVPRQESAPSHLNSARLCALPHGIQDSSGYSCSEREFGWVIGMLRAGIVPTEVTQRLFHAAKERGKRYPQEYAVRTVQSAQRCIDNDTGHCVSK